MQILVAGTKEQVDRAIESAEPFREDMIERGILLVPLPLFGEDAQSGVPTLTSADLKWASSHISEILRLFLLLAPKPAGLCFCP